MNTVAQDLNVKLQATVSEDAMDRIRVTAAIENVTLGQVVTQLAMKYLQPVPHTKSK